MPYCKKCGAELPEYAVFCTKCGLKYPVSGGTTEDYATPQPEQTVTEQKPVVQNRVPEQQNPAPIQHGAMNSTGTQSNWFNNNSMTLFIILGVVSYVLLQFCTAVVNTFGFCVTLGIFAILCAMGFCTIGIIRFVISGKNTAQKRTTCDKVCFALGIIILVYVFFMTVAVLKSSSDLYDVQKAISGIYR